MVVKHLNDIPKLETHNYLTFNRNVTVIQKHWLEIFKKKPNFAWTGFFNKLPGRIRSLSDSPIQEGVIITVYLSYNALYCFEDYKKYTQTNIFILDYSFNMLATFFVLHLFYAKQLIKLLWLPLPPIHNYCHSLHLLQSY